MFSEARMADKGVARFLVTGRQTDRSRSRGPLNPRNRHISPAFALVIAALPISKAPSSVEYEARLRVG